jgi:hypothetical protein
VDPDGHDADAVGTDPDPQDSKSCPCVTPAQAEQLVNDIDRGLDKAAGAVKKAGSVVIIYALQTAIEIIVGPLPPAPAPKTEQPTTATPPSSIRERWAGHRTLLNWRRTARRSTARRHRGSQRLLILIGSIVGFLLYQGIYFFGGLILIILVEFRDTFLTIRTKD